MEASNGSWWRQTGLALAAVAVTAAQPNVEALREAVAPVMALGEAELVELIPDRAGLRFIGCPNCDGGTQENQISWTIERPHEVFCRFCKLRYPNDRYPDDEVQRVTNARGETVEYPYWADENGYRHFFRAKGWYVARGYFEDKALQLAMLYDATGDEAAARRAILILGRFAEVYPGYLVHYDFPFRQKILWSGDDNFPYPVPDYRAAKWNWWAYMDISEDLLRAYDLLKASEHLDDATRQLIERDLFGGMVDFVFNYPPALTNMDPTLLRALITAGKVLERPEWIHESVRRIEALVERQFYADGMWREGAVSYHNQTVGGLARLADLLEGYTDPPGYRPEQGEGLVDFDLEARLPILAKARRVPDLLKYPNGRTVAVHDTWAREGREPLPRSEAMLLPELGHARLGSGEGDGQIQTHLHFSGGYGHQHADVLSMTLFARGEERLGDIGYTHTRYRHWTRSTLSHNTVTVDGQDQHFGCEAEPSDGSLRLFVPGDGDLLSVVEATGERAYPERVETYRRMLAQIGEGDAAYVVDWFRVVGGSRHDYVLTGDPNHAGHLEHDLAMQPYGPMLLPADVEVTLPTGENTPGEAGGHNLSYAFMRQPQFAAVDGNWRMTFRSDGPSDGAVRVHGAALTAGDTLFTATAPSIRGAGENDAELDAHMMPMLVHRRQADEGSVLSSDFTVVVEPQAAEGPRIERVERPPVDGDGIALRIVHRDGTVDLVLATAESSVLTAAGVTLVGRLGFVRRDASGRVIELRLVGGSRLTTEGETLEGAGTTEASLVSTMRGDVNALHVDRPPGLLTGLEGQWAIVTDGAGFRHGHRIERVEAREGETSALILDHDPGYDADASGGEQVYFPGRSWTGPCRVEIATTARWSAPQRGR